MFAPSFYASWSGMTWTLCPLTKLYNGIKQALICGFFMQIDHKEGEKGLYVIAKDNQVWRAV